MSWQSEKQKQMDIDSKHKELKRLQKEIDEANKGRSDLDILTVCFGEDANSREQHKEYMDIIESNQAKIKQIIEELWVNT